jgi:hypothetical protein
VPEAGEIETLATERGCGADTVMPEAAEPAFAVMTAEPAALAVTSPVCETVAMVVSELVQTTVTLCESCVVPPIASEEDDGLTTMDLDTVPFCNSWCEQVGHPGLSFSARPVGSEPGLSVHDKVMQNVKAVISMLISLRFMIIPMNRATSFTRVPKYFYACAPLGAGIHRNRIVTVNAKWTTRIYILQAKGIFRHWILEICVGSLKQPREKVRRARTTTAISVPQNAVELAL